MQKPTPISVFRPLRKPNPRKELPPLIRRTCWSSRVEFPARWCRLSEQGTRLGRSAESSFQINDITVSRDMRLS